MHKPHLKTVIPVFGFRLITVLLALSGIGAPANAQQITYEFTNYFMGSPGAAAFTTNNFTAAGIGAENRIWVGSQYGGLYTMDDDGTELWFKSGMLTNVFINDIASDPDGGIWVAQSGTQSSGGNSNLGGGLNYFPTKYDVDMKLYSIPGAVNDGNLFSRNARSVYVDQTYTTATGKLPRLWVAQGTFITNFNTQRGGVNFGMNPEKPFTIRNVQGFSLLSNTPICESVDGNGTEIWVGVRLNQGRSSILRYNFKGDTIGEYSHLNTPALQNGFFPNAIHFDKSGFKWIGLREGGLRVLTPDVPGEWVSVNLPLIFPPGTQINHNAITSDDLGNVYIGTSNGLVIFKSPDYFGGHPANPDSYTRITTEQGLVNNNVKGMAFDVKYKRLVIATAGGISFLKTRPDNIVGTVFNAAAALDQSPRLGSDLVKSVPPQGFTVKLLDGNIVVDEKTVNGASVYELENANNQKTYSIEIVYDRKNGKNLTYTLPGIKNQSFVPPVLVPDSLLGEVDSLKPKMAEQCFDLSIFFSIKFPKICFGGFNMAQYDQAGTRFRESDNLTGDETLQLYNLANYLTALQAANKMGGQAKELETEGLANLIELVQFALEEFKLKKAVKEFVPADKNPLFESELTPEMEAIMVANLKLIKEGSVLTLKKIVAKYPGDAEVKKNLETTLSMLNDGLDQMINFVENGKNRGVFEMLFGQFKKVLSQFAVSFSHKYFYLESRHANLIPLSSNQSLNKASALDFATVYNNVYNPGTESLVGVAQNQVDEKKKQIENAALIANVSGTAADMSNAASALALIPGGQVAGGIFKALAVGAKLVKGSALLAATGIGVTGAKEIRDSSEKIRYRAGFETGGGGGMPAGKALLKHSALAHGELSAMDSVTARKTRLNQQLLQLNGFYQAPTWQPVAFGNSFKGWRRADSLFTAALSDAFLPLQPYLEEAFGGINGFESYYQVTLDSFFEKRVHANRALFYRTLAWMYVDNRSPEAPGLDSLVNEISRLNDSLANRLGQLTAQIENSATMAGAYLEKTAMVYNHSHTPGSSGSVVITFKNVGPVAMENIRFTMEPLTGGYILNSPDSLFRGTVLPGDTLQYALQFTSPTADSVGRYHLVIEADNGRTPEVSGYFVVVNPNKVFSIKDGNWNDPATWHSGAVPLSTHDVQVGHKVVANTDVSCKSLNVTLSGNLQVANGKKVTILE